LDFGFNRAKLFYHKSEIRNPKSEIFFAHNPVYLALMALRFAIIGCGKIAVRHAEQATKYGKLVAVCDSDKDKANKLAATYNTTACFSIEELLKNDIDLVAVCSPNWLHAEHSIQAMKAGKDVLCEKPMAISSEDANKMIECAGTTGRKLFVVKSTRFNPALISLKKALVGKLYSFQLNCFWNRPAGYYEGTWRGKSKTDGGTLYTQFSHYIDVMLWLFGDLKSVKGFRKNISHQSVTEFEDNGVAALEMENGMIGGLNWSVNTFQKNMEVSLTLIAEKGSVRIGGEYMNKIEYNLSDGFILESGGSGSNHDKVYENLVKNGAESNAVDGLRTVKAIERIYNAISL
jgi:UDP-N-acetyl-2-amino-2-deoxyglucuronate dehydrogenase